MAGAVAERAHERGLQVNVWTVNEPDELLRLARRRRRRRDHRRPRRRPRGAQGDDEGEGVGPVGDVEAVGVAEVVAVDLPGERRGRRVSSTPSTSAICTIRGDVVEERAPVPTLDAAVRTSRTDPQIELNTVTAERAVEAACGAMVIGRRPT